MIGLVLITHGSLAKGFLEALTCVMGPQPYIASVCIQPQDEADHVRENILAAIRSVDQGEGVVLVTDLFGGTPSNLAISIMERGKIEVVAGINLPLLIQLVTARKNTTLAQTLKKAKEIGQKHICIASELLDIEESSTSAAPST